MYKLYGRPGSGSAAVEALFRLVGTECEIVDLGRWAEGETPAELLAINPLGQVPTLVMPDGTIMTESAAICVHIADLHPAAGLSPAMTDTSRAAFLRWMFYLSANVYMSELRYFYPHRYTSDGQSAEAVKSAALDRKTLEWAVFADALAQKPFALGTTLSVVDIYAAMLISWIEDLDTFCERFPNLKGVYRRVADVPEIAAVWARHGMPC